MQKNLNIEKSEKIKKIFFIGRLEKEKGVEYLIEIIKKSINSQKSLEYHIFGDGSYFSYFSDFDKKFVKMYGKVNRNKVFEKLQNEADFLLMPSEFLETFGLSALESLSFGVPVIGFRKGGLLDFIPEELSFNEKNYLEKFFEIIEKNDLQLVDISDFSYQNWLKNLENLTKNFEKILLVHDYSENIGGAEIYVNKLKNELEKIGKKVEIFAYEGELSSKIRKKLFLKSIFSQKNFKILNKKIESFLPDLIWSHTILRFVGNSGMKAIKNSKIPHFITHHDLGLFSIEPSKVRNFDQIPESSRFGSWLNKVSGTFGIIKLFIKYFIIKRIWNNIDEKTIHIFPSKWMIKIAENWDLKNIKIFPHTIFPEDENFSKNISNK